MLRIEMQRKFCVNGFNMQGKILILATIFALSAAGAVGEASPKELLEIRRRLKSINKPSVKSIKSEDGDIIDCVDINKQPAFDHPALKNHTIQKIPKLNHTTVEPTTKGNESGSMTVSQKWHKSGSCPKGTVPIRRIIEKDLLRARSFESYGRKHPSVPVTKANTSTKLIHNNVQNYFPLENVSLSYLLTQGYSYIGAQASINLWNPYVESKNDFSSSQIWLRTGPPNSYESVESGWVVNPTVYGDTETRFFAYWTSDSSRKTGCFDLTCPGFVQTSQKYALGATFSAISQERSAQYEMFISLYLDPDTGIWWLKYGNEVIGYWPRELFSLLHRNAVYVMFGGEVFSPKIRKTPHTETQMGSGNSADHLYGLACFIRHIRIKDYSLEWKFPEWIYAGTDEEYCYNTRIMSSYVSEPEFYFGGPGRNSLCP